MMSSRFLLSALAALFALACSPSDGTGPTPPPPPPPPAPMVTLTVLPNVVEKGSEASVSVSWNSGHTEACTSSWAGSVGLSGSYTFIPTMGISLSVTCTGSGGSKTVTASIQVADPPTLSLSLFAPDGQAGISGLSTRFISGSWDSTVAVEGSSVSVSLTKNVRDRMGATVRVAIDAANTNERKFLPLVGSMSRPGPQGQNVSAVLVPAKWNIPCGTFAEHTEEISLVKAYAQAGDGQTFYRNNLHWEYFPRFWAFDRAESNVEFTPADSLAQEGTWSRLNAAFCETLAKPGTVEQVLAEGGWRFRARTDHPVSANAGSSVKVVGSPHTYWGVTTLRDKARIGTATQEHEILHTLGFGHTCSWFTIMYTNCGVFGSEGVSASDVAYAKLYYAIRKLEVAKSATFGMAEALAGEREIILGLPGSAVSASLLSGEELAPSVMSADALRVAGSGSSWVWFHHDEADHP